MTRSKNSSPDGSAPPPSPRPPEPPREAPFRESPAPSATSLPPDPPSEADAPPSGGGDGSGSEAGSGDDARSASASGSGSESGADDEPGDGTSAEGGGRRRRSSEVVTPPPPDRLEGAVEAVLLAAGESLSAERIRDLLGLPSAVHVRDALAEIRARWATAGLSVEIQDVAGGHRVVTRPEYAEYVKRLWRRAASDRLSQTLLETLSIVAYKQPVARAEIERIRGVQCGETLRGLLERRLLKVAGRSDQPGRPLLYATTARFLEVFGLAGLEDLPSAKDLARL